MHSSRSGIHGIWDPMLLLHLGGPDAINAYSSADNELWLGHGFNMLYQVSVAVHVINSSALEGYALVSAIFLLVAGATKYGERTLALWFASYSQILMSCLPISSYIKGKNVLLQDRAYIVMGEKQLQRMIEKKSGESSAEGSKVQKLVGGDRYWSNGIHQHCLIGTCVNRSRVVWKMGRILPKADIYIASWHIHKVSVPEELKDFIFKFLKQICSPKIDIETYREQIFNFEEDLLKGESEIMEVMSAHDSLEEVILVWHIATAICDRQTKPSEMIQNMNENVRWSIILSRYCIYLLVSRPRLLPVHLDMESITYMQLVDQLMGEGYYGKDPTELLE
ncbi:hypothetical protein SUGI_0562540 [Cryptomeria japonica]|nr:hypothetical protein SUGI_0562540 [Cryptomeria japonica]